MVWEKFCQLWQIEMRTVPLSHEHPTLNIDEAIKMCDENTICVVPIAGVTWTGMNDDICQREIFYLTMKTVGVGEVEESHCTRMFMLSITTSDSIIQ